MKELRLEGISTIETANAFMPTYVDHYNALGAGVEKHRVRDIRDLDFAIVLRLVDVLRIKSRMGDRKSVV